MHTLASLDTLLSMATKKGKRESVMAVGEWSHELPSLHVLMLRILHPPPPTHTPPYPRHSEAAVDFQPPA